MNTSHPKNLKLQKLVSLLVTFLGFLLLIFMIVVEDEPGALPLALIVTGITWFFYIRSKLRSKEISS